MFEFWREATATSVPGLFLQSGRRRPENVSILSSLIPDARPSVNLKIKIPVKVRRGISKQYHENVGDCEQSR